jgi:hypothetical protein
VILAGFVINENYADEPVLPLRLWKNSIFTLNADDECPRLVAAASALAPDEPNAPGPPHERARFYAREVVRPLALQMMLAARGAGAELASR